MSDRTVAWPDATSDAIGLLTAAPAMLMVVGRDEVVSAASLPMARALGLTPADLVGRPLASLLRGEAPRPGAAPAEVAMLGAGGVVPLVLEVGAAPDGRRVLWASEPDGRGGDRALLHAISHDLRTPLNAVMGYAQLLQMAELSPRSHAHVEAILAASADVVALLTERLDPRPAPSEPATLSPTPMDPRDIAAGAEARWAAPARDRGLTLRMEVLDGLPERLVADGARVAEVLDALIEDALASTPSGGVTVTLSAAPPVEGPEGPRALLRLEVADTGPGIEPERLPTLFEACATPRAGSGGGRGLRLPECRRSARALGGDLELVPGPFGVRLRLEVDAGPAEREEGVPSTEAGEGPAHGGADATPRALSVLVADDNPHNATVARALLTKMGHSVTIATDGMEAFEAVMRERFDVVLMDISMPRLDGVKAAERIRLGTADWRDLPIVACTAHVTDDTRERCRRAGMDGFVPKPVNREVLSAAIQAASARLA